MTYNKADGSPVTARAGVALANVATSWERVYSSLTIVAGTNGSYWFSHNKADLAGILIDNVKIEEIGMTAGGIASIVCNNNGTVGNVTDDKINFTLNPIGTVEGLVNFKYNVTAPSGYTISPSQGIYGVATAFVLTKTAGSAPGSGNVTITLTDEVNTNCSITETVIDPGVCTVSKGSIGDYVWKDANNNGIQDGTELPVQGVQVQLLSSTGAVLATDTTDINGLYLFPNLSS